MWFACTCRSLIIGSQLSLRHYCKSQPCCLHTFTFQGAHNAAQWHNITCSLGLKLEGEITQRFPSTAPLLLTAAPYCPLWVKCEGQMYWQWTSNFICGVSSCRKPLNLRCQERPGVKDIFKMIQQSLQALLVHLGNIFIEHMWVVSIQSWAGALMWSELFKCHHVRLVQPAQRQNVAKKRNEQEKKHEGHLVAAESSHWIDV